jgi:hypothetical protein
MLNWHKYRLAMLFPDTIIALVGKVTQQSAIDNCRLAAIMKQQ